MTTENQRIEDLYAGLRKKGTAKQLTEPVSAARVTAGFIRTVDAVAEVVGSGSFYPPTSRTPMVDLLTIAAPSERIVGTPDLQSRLWRHRRWAVQGQPELDFFYADREISPSSSAVKGKRGWLMPEFQMSLDALLVNVDRTPIVAEIKVGGDQNAEYALVQALAAAAQLTPTSQRERLRDVYHDLLGPVTPTTFDVYVLLAHRPPRGAKPKLLARALELGAELESDGAVAPWIRRIRFLDVTPTEQGLAFRVLPHATS